MRKLLGIALLGIALLSSCQNNEDYIVTFHTKYGDMKAILYDEAPKHKQNFINLVKKGAYDSTTFYRIVQGFMIQGGDINAKPNLPAEQKIDYTIPEEINPKFMHTKGALAAARQGDETNPQKRSDGSQFYIVQGKKYSLPELKDMEKGRNYYTKQLMVRRLLGMKDYRYLRDSVMRMQKREATDELQAFMQNIDPTLEEEFGKIPVYHFSKKQLNTYMNEGGAPHLDGEYTIFGRVVEGLNVIDSIAAQPTKGDRAINPVYMKVTLKEVPKKQITKKYGYEYPKDEE